VIAVIPTAPPKGHRNISPKSVVDPGLGAPPRIEKAGMRPKNLGACRRSTRSRTFLSP
jgi:hypothetical protein